MADTRKQLGQQKVGEPIMDVIDAMVAIMDSPRWRSIPREPLKFYGDRMLFQWLPKTLDGELTHPQLAAVDPNDVRRITVILYRDFFRHLRDRLKPADAVNWGDNWVDELWDQIAQRCGVAPQDLTRWKGPFRIDSLDHAPWIHELVKPLGNPEIAKLFFVHAALIQDPDDGSGSSGGAPTETLHVNILAGSNKGKRQVFESAAVTFGREADNDLVIDDPHVSRHHGRIQFEQGKWVVVNQSDNGTKVGRKSVTNKPGRLRDGDTLSVVDLPILQVQMVSRGVVATTNDDGEAPFMSDAPQEAAPAPGGMSRKAKLWLVIGGWWLAMMVIVAIFATLGDGPTEDSDPLPEMWTRTAIEVELARPLDGIVKDTDDAANDLRMAEQAYVMIESDLAQLPRAYRNYRFALARFGRSQFGSEADLHYQDVKKQMADRMFDWYEQGYQAMEAGRYREAVTEFKRVLDLYRDTQSKFHGHVEKLLLVAQPKAGKKPRD